MGALALPFKKVRKPKSQAKRRKCVECSRVDSEGSNAPRELTRDGNRYRYKKPRWLCSSCYIPIWEKYLSDVKKRMQLIWLSSILGYPATSSDVAEYKLKDTHQESMYSNVNRKKKKAKGMKWVFKDSSWVATLKKGHKAKIHWDRNDENQEMAWRWDISKKGKSVASGKCGSRSQAEFSMKIVASDMGVI